MFNSQKTTEPTTIRTQVLRGLPIILGDNPTNFFKASFESDDDDYFRDLDVGILLIEREGAVLTSSQHLSPASLKIVIEGEVVMENIQDLPKAMCIWTHVCTSSLLPQDHEAHISVHPTGIAIVRPD